MDARVRDEVMAADRAFAAEVAAAAGEARARAWADWFTPDGRQILPAAVVDGREAVFALMAPAFADTVYRLEWAPDQGGGRGDCGWTSGRYVNTRRGGNGEPVVSEGRYLTVWEREPGGPWRVAVDTGIPD